MTDQNNNRDSLIWMIVFGLGAAVLLVRFFTGGVFGLAYVEGEDSRFVNVAVDGAEANWVNFDSEAILDHPEAAQDYDALRTAGKTIEWTTYRQAHPRDYTEAADRDAANGTTTSPYSFSVWRTVGIWAAAFFTLAIFSFLYKDNPLYKVAESVVVGVSAAYWMVVGFWDVIVPNLLGKLSPATVQAWAMPGLDASRELLYLVPLALGIMLLWRLAPKGAWISRWSLAFIIGTTAGIRLIGFVHADFLTQIRNSIVPVLVMDNGFDFWESLRNVILLVGVLTCLVYFFFSFEHKGAIGGVARVGIWFLMITFGAAFGYTVMGRIALLAIRLEFLFDDWLWLIDPTGRRAVAMLIHPLIG